MLESILLEQLARIGTGSFDLSLDVKKCSSSMELQLNYPIENSFGPMMSDQAMKLFAGRNSTGSTTSWNYQFSSTPEHFH